MISVSRMEQRKLSTQEVIRLLSQLNELRGEYPPDLLAARRKVYLSIAKQLVVTHIAVDDRKNQFLSSIEREPIAVVVKALIAVFVAFLIAYIAHSLATGIVDFGWLIELLTR
jgi:hypothetical protein